MYCTHTGFRRGNVCFFSAISSGRCVYTYDEGDERLIETEIKMIEEITKMKNSKMELKMDEMEQVAAGNPMEYEAQGSWAEFVRAVCNITKAVYNKIVYAGED